MKRVTIAVASPGDLRPEREAVLRVFANWNDNNQQATLTAKMWEFAVPELGGHPQKILNKRLLDSSDLLIAMFWSKLGTPTPTAPSGTVEEIREFIEKKGAQRVMLYFCNRPVPVDIDPTELMRLNAFKEEIRKEGLYQQFASVEEFERNLYPHLDVKVEEVLSNEILLPIVPEPDNKPKSATEVYSDPQLRNPVDFGTSLESISRDFAERMKVFQAVDGIGNGTNKYYRLGSHVYTSAAVCVDRFLLHSAKGMRAQDVAVLERLSTRLKRLASSIPAPGADFRQYWNDGSEIAEALLAHASHVARRQ